MPKVKKSMVFTYANAHSQLCDFCLKKYDISKSAVLPRREHHFWTKWRFVAHPGGPFRGPKILFFLWFLYEFGCYVFFCFVFDVRCHFLRFRRCQNLPKPCVLHTKRDFACYQKVIILAWFLTIKNQPWTSTFIIFRRHLLLKIMMRKNWKHQIRVVYATLREGQCFANFIEISWFSCSFILLSFDPLRDHFSSILMVPETM